MFDHKKNGHDDNPLDVDVCLPKVSDKSNPAKLPRKNQSLVKWKAGLWEQICS